MRPIAVRLTLSILSFAAALATVSWRADNSAAAEPPAKEEQKQPDPEAARLEQMKGRARLATIQFVAGERERKIELHPQPLMRYKDAPRGFRDGTLWLWTAGGRPVAVEKVEDLRTGAPHPRWLTCMASLAPERFAASWDSGRSYVFKKAGVDFRPLKDAPAPEERDAGRLRQFKAQAQRFTATLQQYGTEDRQEMRLLPRFVHRYAIPAEGISDAIIFAWTANGTNPDALLLIELRTRDKQPTEWSYSLVGVTADTVYLKLGDDTVQTKAHTMAPGDETLTFFFERNEEPID